jgi:hypothetical protein
MRVIETSELLRPLTGKRKFPHFPLPPVSRARSVTSLSQHSIQQPRIKINSYEIEMDKQWIATLDDRTRDNHAHMHMEKAEMDEPFSNGLMHPLDPDGPPEEVINCRCSVVSVLRGSKGSKAYKELEERISKKAMEEYRQSEEFKLERKKIENAGADRVQFAEYKSAIGKGNIPSTFDKFQEMKYTRPDEWERIKGYRRYTGRVPEATLSDYDKYRVIKDAGITGHIRVPPLTVETSNLTFDAAHIAERGRSITRSEAIGFIKNAEYSVHRVGYKDETWANYYSKAGTAYVNVDEGHIKTAFRDADYKNRTKNAFAGLEKLE